MLAKFLRWLYHEEAIRIGKYGVNAVFIFGRRVYIDRKTMWEL